MRQPAVTDLRIGYLADHPEFIDTLAAWLLEQWRPILVHDTLASRVDKLRAHLNRETLPIAWVAHDGAQVLGTCALRRHDLPGREDLTPWLGGAFVASSFRHRGIGLALCETVEVAAAALGWDTLYLFTLDAQAWYRHHGWSALSPCTWCGRAGDIMVKRLTPANP